MMLLRAGLVVLGTSLVAATALAGCLAETGGAVDATVVDAVEGDTLPPSDAVTGDTLASSDTVTLDTEGPIDTSPLADTAAVDGADTGPPAGTCAARCGTFSVGESCQCDAPCVQYGNCCADYEALCATGPAATDFLVAQGDDCADAADWIAVTHVRDGDTVDVASGDAVRFLLVDTPELSSDDCVAWDARAFTAAEIAASGDSVCLVTDPTSTDRDLYNRLLRYVYVRDAGAGGQPINLNVRLIRLGYGRLLYPYASGRVYEPEGKTAQAAAASEGLGGWGACGW